jgi:hypothetical protein
MNENEIHKLVVNDFLLNWVVLQWCPTAGEDIPMPNTKKLYCFPTSSSVESDSPLATSPWTLGLLSGRTCPSESQVHSPNRSLCLPL